ncbi:MAG TPA: NAD(P)-dependent oxidoreductase [Desulfomonilia bacterium]
MNILITGSSGYLGRNTVRHAIKEGHEVTGFDLKPSGFDDSAFNEIISDITDEEAVTKAVAGHDAVIHSAAALAQFVRDEDRLHRINVWGTLNVLSAALKHNVRKVVFISSVEVYGVDVPNPCPEDAPMRPLCQYGRDKLDCEILCKKYMDMGLNITIFRPPTINGAGQNEPFLVDQMRSISKGGLAILPGGGKTRLQMVNIDDVSSACMMAIRNPDFSNRTLNLGSENVPTLEEMTTALFRHAGKRPRELNIPAGLARFAVRLLSVLGISPLEPQHLEIALKDYVFDIKRAKALGWKPLKDDIQSAKDAYDWLIKQEQIKRNFE